MTTQQRTTAYHRRGELPRPRTLFLGSWENQDVENIARLVGYTRREFSFSNLPTTLPAAEVDLVLLRLAPNIDNWLDWKAWTTGKYVIHFVGQSGNELAFPAGDEPKRLLSRRTEFTVTAAAGELQELARRSTAEVHSAVNLPIWQHQPWSMARVPFGECLVGTDEGPCAIYDATPGGKGPRALLVIPEAFCEHVSKSEWIAAALRAWKPLAPEVFPRVQTWREEQSWWTTEQRRVEDELRTILAEFELTQKSFLAKQAALRTALHEEVTRAESAERRLLTAQDDELVDAVRKAFERLGFTVDVPEEESTSEKVEDLLLRREGWLDWTASVEVKGSATGSAKLDHAIKLDKRRTRRGTVQAILVINAQCGLPPQLRHALFNSEARGNLESLAVLALDSRSLYKSLFDPELAEAVVAAVRESTGVFEPGANL